MKSTLVFILVSLSIALAARTAPDWACNIADAPKAASNLAGNSLRAPAVVNFHAEVANATVSAQQVLAVDPASLAALMQPGNLDVLVVFYAPWCGHCKTFVLADFKGNPDNAPIERLNRDLIAAKGPKVVKYDTAAHAVPAGFPFEYIPTIYLAKKDGSKLMWRGATHIGRIKEWALANAALGPAPVVPAAPAVYQGGAVAAAVSLVEQQSCVAEDVKRRTQVQNKLAGLCETMCKEVGSYPKCAACPNFVAPDATPGVMTWEELLPHMDNLAAWGKDQLKGWNKRAR